MTFDQILKPDELQGAYVATATEFRSCYIENKGKAGFTLRRVYRQYYLLPHILRDDLCGALPDG